MFKELKLTYYDNDYDYKDNNANNNSNNKTGVIFSIFWVMLLTPPFP